jgi:hypothetical protein
MWQTSKEAHEEATRFLSFLQAISLYKEGKISLEDLSLQVKLILIAVMTETRLSKVEAKIFMLHLVSLFREKSAIITTKYPRSKPQPFSNKRRQTFSHRI